MTTQELIDLLGDVPHKAAPVWVQLWGGASNTQSMAILRIQAVDVVKGISCTEIIVKADPE